MTLVYIGIGLAVLVAIFLIVVAMRPADFRVARSTTIAAPPMAIFPLINDLHQWGEWSPWEKMDPNSTKTYDGPPTGVGSSFHWNGNKKVGEGIATIIESRPGEVVRIKLQFLRPFKATNTAEFSFKPQGEKTNVTWAMTGHNNFFFKAFSLFMNCDDMVGKDFEKGLAAMKSIAESSANRVPAGV